jgi:hypothetical protein
MKKIPAVVLAVLLCAASGAPAADAVKGCYLKANGQLRVLIPPDTCRPSELPITLTTGAIADRSAPAVYDSGGQFLGVSLQDAIYVPSLKRYLSIYDSGDVDVIGLWYATTDCTGPGYYAPDWGGAPGSATALWRQWISTVGGKYYTPGSAVPAGTVARSYYADQNGVCSPIDGEMAFNERSALAVEVKLPFKTPVALPLTFENLAVGAVPRLRRP